MLLAWLDRYEIEGGVGWWNQVEQELDRAEYLILVMTPRCLAIRKYKQGMAQCPSARGLRLSGQGVPDAAYKVQAARSRLARQRKP